jgi:hypothetical protein
MRTVKLVERRDLILGLPPSRKSVEKDCRETLTLILGDDAALEVANQDSIASHGYLAVSAPSPEKLLSFGETTMAIF